jgi:hemerythrin superfamily protein
MLAPASTRLGQAICQLSATNTFTGYTMDAIEFLIDQHRLLEARLDAAVDATDAQAKASLLKQLGDHLSMHIASEEQIFYPEVKARRTEDILLESLEEHLSLKRLLADLLALSPTAQTYAPKLKVLKEQAEHHHAEEEENLFPKVRKLLGAKQLDELGSQMLALQERLGREGVPRELMAEQTTRAAPLK